MHIVFIGDNLHEMSNPVLPRKPDLTFHANCPMETICMKCLILFPGENKKNIKFSSAELAQRVIKVKKKSRYVVIKHVFTL